MKTNLYRNIDLLRINVKAGVNEYYFPQNVDWAAKKVDRIAICAPEAACVDPMDGQTPVMTLADLAAADCYVDIYSADQREILHAVSAENILHLNNHPLYLNSKLDLSLCCLYFKTAPVQDMTLLLYVYHDNKCVENPDMPSRSVTVLFPLQAGEEINFRKIINTYVHALPATIKGVSFWGADQAPAYMTLRDHKLTYILQNLHSELARPMMNGGGAVDTQINGMLLDNIDIDFEYSHIRNCGANDNNYKITFWY